MSVRSRLAARLADVAGFIDRQAEVTLGTPAPEPAVKATADPAPADMALAGEVVSQMGMQYPFAPGEPLPPYYGYGRTPRAFDFQTGYNIATRPRTHERVSFDTLRGLIDAYDVAQIAIWHRIDSVRSLDWKLVPADGFTGDPTSAIQTGLAALDKPDRVTSFETWLGKWLFDVLAFDAGALYRMRNRGGGVIGLSVVDGTTIAPLLDYWGNPPQPPAEAYVQYVNGVPWNWLTRNDLIYEPYRPSSRSVYGRAPLEAILLNANTDVRFQLYFLQRFTEGNVPEAFASAPETWSADQIEQWQTYWDSMLYGEQGAKHQIKWMPGGSTIAWSNEKDFTDKFSLFLMRKTCAAYHVVPSDLGFTEDVNRSSGESQADVQHRVGDLPLIRYVQRILTGFLREDLGLPLRFAFDIGEEQDDRLQQAQADQIYIDEAVVSASEIRQMRFGLPEAGGRPVPRFINSSRSGPVPLDALYALAGQIDPLTAAPAPGVPLPQTAFTGVPGIVPNPPLEAAPLAEDEFGPAALPPQPAPAGAAPVGKEATAGVTSATGITGYDGPGRREDEDDDETQTPGAREQQVEKARTEQAAFRRYVRARKRTGMWRDFEFAHTAPLAAHRLNDSGRLAVRKAAGEIGVAGLAVRAADTGRVLMIQRANDPDDPAGGSWEFPGGHVEDGEGPLDAAWREWGEESGRIPPPGTLTGTWDASNGIYRGFVWTVESESSVPVRSGTLVANPDDPDGDQVEAIAWWEPGQLPGNPAVRAELAADLPLVLAALDPGDPGDTPGDDDVAKAVSGDPKARRWAGWDLDLDTVAYWHPRLTAAIAAVLHKRVLDEMASAYLTQQPQAGDGQQGKRQRNQAAAAWLWLWLGAEGITLDPADVAAGIVADGMLIGATSAVAYLAGRRTADTAGWKPGDTATAATVTAALVPGAGDAAAGHAVTAAGQIAQSYVSALGRTLVDGADAAMTVTALSAALAAVVRDAGHARLLTQDQLTRAIGHGSIGHGQAAGAVMGRWVTEDDAKVCDICLGNAAAGLVPLGEPYPSGDIVAPAHPFGRCAVVPEPTP